MKSYWVLPGRQARSFKHGHNPERTLLYQIVEEYYPAFMSYLAAQGRALPEKEKGFYSSYKPAFMPRPAMDAMSTGLFTSSLLHARGMQVCAVPVTQLTGYSKL